MEFIVHWKCLNGDFNIDARYFGNPHTFIWPHIGEYVEVSNPHGQRDIIGEVSGIIKRYDIEGRCEVEILVNDLTIDDAKETKHI